jgi:hypothetical protein
MTWDKDQQWEKLWWGDCANTFGEESKQISYAYRMGLENVPVDGHWPVYNIEGRSVLDIGGGPASLLLKTVNPGRRVVIDPCPYPEWILSRYEQCGIEYYNYTGEEYLRFSAYKGQPTSPLREVHFDECWIYNVLQHVQEPEKIIANARKSADIIRLFEWIDMPASIGHPHTLTKPSLDDWLGVMDSASGVEVMQGENDCYGKAYFGCFAT